MNLIHIQTKQRAFTLAELLVTLAIVSILATIAVSGFSALAAEIRMTSQVNNLVHSLHLARHKSRLLGTDVVLCKSTDQRQCNMASSGHSGWHTGWLLFANNDRDQPPQTDPGEPLLASGTSSNSLHISANRHAFIMRPFGKRSTNGTFLYCDHRGAAAARAIIVSYTGKPNVRRTDTNGEPLVCPTTEFES